jgi:hypothetical protein
MYTVCIYVCTHIHMQCMHTSCLCEYSCVSARIMYYRIFTHTHACIYALYHWLSNWGSSMLHTCTQLYIAHTHTHIYIYIYTRTYIHAYTHTRDYTFCIYINICIYTHIYIYIHTCIYTHIHTRIKRGVWTLHTRIFYAYIHTHCVPMILKLRMSSLTYIQMLCMYTHTLRPVILKSEFPALHTYRFYAYIHTLHTYDSQIRIFQPSLAYSLNDHIYTLSFGRNGRPWPRLIV